MFNSSSPPPPPLLLSSFIEPSCTYLFVSLLLLLSELFRSLLASLGPDLRARLPHLLGVLPDVVLLIGFLFAGIAHLGIAIRVGLGSRLGFGSGAGSDLQLLESLLETLCVCMCVKRRWCDEC